MSEKNTKSVEEEGFELGRKMGEIGDQASRKINDLIKGRGVKAVIQIQLLDEITGNVLV